MPERRPASSSTTTTAHRTTSSTSVRRNLFHQHLSRRPTTSSTSTSSETLRLDMDHESDSSSEIVMRDQDGNFEIGELADNGFDVHEEGGAADALEEEKERRRLADAVKRHQRANRAPSEPAELLESVKTALRAKVAALADDNWMYDAEEEVATR